MKHSLFNRIAGIVLAAGTASRMGETKQLLPFKGTTILGRVLRSALDSKLDRIFLVLGHDADRIKLSLKNEGTLSRVRVILNTHYKNGQSTSLIAGVDALPADIDAAMFLLGDQPSVTPPLINSLTDRFSAADAPIAVPYFKNRRGNPVIISRALFDELMSLSADTGARVLFKRHTGNILKINVRDPAVLADVDTPEDYRRLTAPRFPDLHIS